MDLIEGRRGRHIADGGGCRIVDEGALSQNPDRKYSTGEEEFHIPQAVWIIRDEGDKGTAVERVELKSPDAKPVRLLLKDFGKYTRTKPLRTPPKGE